MVLKGIRTLEAKKDEKGDYQYISLIFWPTLFY